jgi:hypothetical protein
VSFLAVDQGSGLSDLIRGVEGSLQDLALSTRTVHARAESELEPAGPGAGQKFDWILVHSDGPRLACHSSGFRNVLVLTPESVRRSIPILRGLRKDCGIDRVDVVVNSVTDPALARKVFFDVSNEAKSRLGMNLLFLGHCNRRSLLDWKEHAMKACFGLIAKRLSGERA